MGDFRFWIADLLYCFALSFFIKLRELLKSKFQIVISKILMAGSPVELRADRGEWGGGIDKNDETRAFGID